MLVVGRIRSPLLISICALTLSVSAFADSQKQIDVPAGDLTIALRQLAQQSGVEFVYSAEDLRGVQTQGAHGKLTTEEAVN